MSTGVPGRDALALAEEAYELVQISPRRALVVAEQAVAAADAEADPRAEVVALHALAWAQLQLGDARAIDTVRTGIRTAERHNDRRGEGLLRRRLAFTHAVAGETRAARRELEAAIALLDGPDRVQSEVFRLDIHRRTQTADSGAQREVLAAAKRALISLRRSGDAIWEARLLSNRGLLFSECGELDAAEADHRRAHALFTRLGAEAAALDAATALADIARMRGDLVSCLRTLDKIQSLLPAGHASYNIEFSRATALAEARLLPEARAATMAYIELCAQAGFTDELAKTRLDLARIALMSLDSAAAGRIAAAAARSFAARGNRVNAALARGIWLRALLVEGGLRRSSVRSGLDAAEVLESAGWRSEALRTRLLVARVALALGLREIARQQLSLAGPLRARGRVTDRIELLHVRALLDLADRQTASGERLLVAGLRLLDEYRAAFGAIELQATASAIGVELSQQGLLIAIESQAPAKILAWAERLRANALRLPLVQPPADPELSALQAKLRRVAAEIREAERDGRMARGVAARQGELEATIRSRTRLLKGEGAARSSVPRVRDAAAALDGRALVEYVELDGALGALTLAHGRLVFHELGPNSCTAELDWLHFALGRLARGRNDPAQRAGAASNARASAAALDKLLVEPLLPALGEASLVVVPTGALHALPWGALPSLRGRPLVVAPSFSVWLDLTRLPRSRRRKATVIAGPRLRHSAAEVREVASLLSSPTVLQGRAANAKAALAALDGAALAHIACHGHFRADSPLFSSLELADGPLNVYELQGLRRAPEVVVLSACDLAVSGLHPGDELLGFAAALLGMGTRTIVASVVPVPDAAARRLMLAFHRNLAAGAAPTTALARAQAGARVAGFVCLGSG